MKSPIIKRSVLVDGHRTSVTLEDPFWNSLKDIASSQGLTLSETMGAINSGRERGSLSSAIRLFVLEHYVNRNRRGHGHEHPSPETMKRSA